MTTNRTDIHRPSAIQPEDYVFVAMELLKIEDLGDCLALQAERRALDAHRERTGAKWSGHAHGGNCMICGNANAVYTAVFHHEATNTYVRVGSTCAQKMEMGEAERFRSFAQAMRDYRDAQAGKRKAELTLADYDLTRAWEIAQSLQDDPRLDQARKMFAKGDKAREAGASTEEVEAKFWGPARQLRDQVETRQALTIRDIVAKLVRYGSISEKQVAFLRKLVDGHDNAQAIQAKRQEERDAAKPAPKGRVEITGVVVGKKWHENSYGGALKLTVKTTEGWMGWVSAPDAWLANGQEEGVQVGDTVQLKATWQPSDRDPKFAFGKRPTPITLTPDPTRAQAAQKFQAAFEEIRALYWERKEAKDVIYRDEFEAILKRHGVKPTGQQMAALEGMRHNSTRKEAAFNLMAALAAPDSPQGPKAITAQQVAQACELYEVPMWEALDWAAQNSVEVQPAA